MYTDAKKYQKIEFTDIKNKKFSIPPESTDGYIAMVQHYFASAWLLPDGVKREMRLDSPDFGANTPDCCYRVQMITGFVSGVRPIQDH